MTIDKDWNFFQKFIYRATSFIVSLRPLLSIDLTNPLDLFYVEESTGWIQYKIISFALIKLPRQKNPVWMISLTLWIIELTYTSVFLSSLMSTLTKKKS